MSLISRLMPLNLQEQMLKFRADRSYNPQFTYAQIIKPTTLTRYGLPKSEILVLAQKYLAAAGTSETYHQADLLTPAQVKAEINALYGRLQLPLPKIQITTQRLARITVGKGRILLRKDLCCTAKNLRSQLAHEVQVHYLRSYNQAQQSFARQRHREYIRTEEGLAILLSNYYKARPDFSNVCRVYLAIDQAQRLSFAQLFAWREQFVPNNFIEVWTSCVRCKRGLTDTSQPGGLTKDLVYLEGLIEVLDYLGAGGKLADLYLGKISAASAAVLKPQAKLKGLAYPELIPAGGDPPPDFGALVRDGRRALGLPPL